MRCCFAERLVLLLFGWIATAAGCAPSTATTDHDNPNGQYVPSAAQAEAALRQVFESWKNDIPPGMIPETSPAVHVTDTFRRPDEKLIDYRILGEVPSERKRCIAVELRFDPEREERTRFLVVGIDPLWVFRQEDAENLAHWEHNMDPPNALQEVGSADAVVSEADRPIAAQAAPAVSPSVKPDPEALP